jgi:hypothetical protein
MQFCVTRVILRDLAALVPQIFHSLHKITYFLTGYINSYFLRKIGVCFTSEENGESKLTSEENVFNNLLH